MELTTRECTHHACTAQVADVVVVGVTRNSRAVIDPEPVKWGEGVHYRLRSFQPQPDKIHVAEVRTANQGFGVTLYRAHSTTCKGGTGKRTKAHES